MVERHDERTLFALYIGTLLRKHADNLPLEEQEERDLEEWRNSSIQRQKIFLESADKAALVTELRRLAARYDSNKAVADIFNALNLDPSAVEHPHERNRHPKLLFVWLTAAAVVACIIFGIALLVRIGHKGNGPGPSSPGFVKNDIPPGRNTATLTLSNGRQILLDSVKDGMLARQGNARIDRQGGRVVYSSSASNTAEVEYNTLSTPRGGQYQLELPDGSKVWLDAESSITYPASFTGNTRRVSVSGQAYFEVAHRAQMPFEVKVLGQTIRDIGTSFNINAYPDEPSARITLAGGAIAVTAYGKELVLKKAGQQVELADNSIRQTNEVSLESVLGWKNGLFYLSSADIAAVMRQLARWYDIDVSFEQGVPSGHISGKLPRDTKLSTVLKALETSGVHFRIDGRKLLITP